MQNQNPSEDDPTNKFPSSLSHDHTHTLCPTNDNLQGKFLMKTPWQVLEELSSSGDDNDDNGDIGEGNPVAVAVGGGGGAPAAVVVDGGDCHGSVGDGAFVAVAPVDGNDDDHSGGDGGNGGGDPVAVAVDGGGGSTVGESVVVSEGVQGKKRKTSAVRDPPTGKPTCPLCQREFLTWKGAFGHMRAHPDRDYRGFFKPPAFGSPSSTQDKPLSDDKGDDSAKKSASEVNNGEKKSASTPARVLMFDLNEPIEEEGSSHAAEPAEEKSAEEGKGLGFDLNEMPAGEDY